MNIVCLCVSSKVAQIPLPDFGQNKNIEWIVLDDNSEWYIDLKNGTGSYGKGQPANAADVTFTLKSADFAKMFTGKLKPTTAFMTGKLKIAGNMGKAMALEKLMGKMQKRSYSTLITPRE